VAAVVGSRWRRGARVAGLGYKEKGVAWEPSHRQEEYVAPLG
jgi:hypothetical protein